MKTVSFNKENTEHLWYVIDAQNVVLGRMATEIANRLRGKHKPTFNTHVDTGDYVVVINAEKVKLTGNKLNAKLYHRYSGYPGGLHSLTAREVLDRDPTRVLTQAVKGMLPKNRLARQVIGKLKVYAGGDHPHAAQNPTPFPEFI